MPAPFALKIRIITPRLDETRAFYTRVLGLVVAEEWDEPGDTGCILDFRGGKGEAYLEIYLGSQAHHFDGLSLQFRTADLAASLAALPADIERRGPVRRPWGSTYAYLKDPNGIEVILFEGGL